MSAPLITDLREALQLAKDYIESYGWSNVSKDLARVTASLAALDDTKPTQEQTPPADAVNQLTLREALTLARACLQMLERELGPSTMERGQLARVTAALAALDAKEKEAGR